MKARIYYTKGNKRLQLILEDPLRDFRPWCEGLGVVVARGGMFVGADFAFPTRNIYYVEEVTD